VCHLRALGGHKSTTPVADLAAAQHGVLTVDELRACGLTTKQIRGRVAAGHLHRVHQGVYAVGHAGITPEGRFLAAVKACGPGAVLSHASAAMLYGLLSLDDRRPEVTISRRRAPRGVTAHHARNLHPDDTWRHRGIPATSAARVALDLAARYDDLPLRRLMSRAKAANLTNHRLLGQQLDRAGGHQGRGRFARVLAADPPPTRSELEDRVHDLLLAAGFRAPDVNRALRLEGRRVVPDFRWPDLRLVVEADGARWHDAILDAERQALLERHGERVLRVTWEDATAGIAGTVQRLDAAGAPRVWPARHLGCLGA
jgi:very-short-patch-repair endonuclease